MIIRKSYRFEKILKYCNFDEMYNNKSKSCILEVDLTYPHSLHEEHADLPFCPERQIPPNGKYSKLYYTLNNKRIFKM